MPQPRTQLLIAALALMLLAAAGFATANNTRLGGRIGDAASGLEFEITQPWDTGKIVPLHKNTPHMTSGVTLTCDVDVCPEPAQVAVITGTVGDLLDDERYGADGNLDNDRAFKRVFERLQGIPMPETVERIHAGDLYGFRVISTTPDRYGVRHPVAGDFLIRGRNLISISVALLSTLAARDEADAIVLLDRVRANLRVDGKSVEN